MNSKHIELLGPGGNVDSIKAAIVGGADAIYCGLDKFNARNKSEKITFNDLQGILYLAHKNNCKVFLTLNIVILENEISSIVSLLNKLVNTSIDGVIIQDIGLFFIVSEHFKSLKIHASTQTTTHNKGQIQFLKKFNIDRVNLARELNISEIKDLTKFAKSNNIETEIFVHGSYCISFSGACYISSVQSGNSGNRGRCSQPCRDKYLTTENGNNYPLNLKDNSAFNNIDELVNAGVSSLKIEGRIKKYDYVYTVVNTWRKHINNYYSKLNSIDNSDLYKVFNRDFTNGFLTNKIGKNMFIDNPRDNSIKHLSDINKISNELELEQASTKLYSEKDKIKESVKAIIDKISINKQAIEISVFGENSKQLKVIIKIDNNIFIVYSKSELKAIGNEELNYEIIYKRFKTINDTEFTITKLDVNLKTELFLAFSEITSLKNNILSLLFNGKTLNAPIELPQIKNLHTNKKTSISVLISSINDIDLLNKTNAEIYFEVPSSLENNYQNYIELFKTNTKLTPWFQSIIIGDDFETATNFLIELKPSKIITNNTGIANFASENGIKWIAGPQFNIVNSYSLLALKEKFNCSGAFISNELNKNQIKNIKSPNNFTLHYSIYHPIVTMTSRACLFQQVSGCEKNIVDNTCISDCEKTDSITNTKQQAYFINKSKGNYNELYNGNNFSNIEIINDLPDFFDSFLLDLRSIKTNTEVKIDKAELIRLFEDSVSSNTNSINKIKNNILFTTNSQYKKGL